MGMMGKTLTRSKGGLMESKRTIDVKRGRNDVKQWKIDVKK